MTPRANIMTGNTRKVAGFAMLLASISVVSPAMADGHGGGGWHGGGETHGDWHDGDAWGWGLLGLGLGGRLCVLRISQPPSRGFPSLLPPHLALRSSVSDACE